MPMPRRRSSFLGQQPSSSTTESTGATSQRLSIGGTGSLPRPRGVYVGIVPTGGVSSLGTRVSRRALGISSVFLQGLRSSCLTVPLAQGLEKGRGLSYESLNGCLVEYIEKVRALEQVNQELEEHIRIYLEKKSSDVNSWEALRENWETIYHQVGDAVLENARLMLQMENIQACAEDFKDRYENEQPFRKAVEDEINSLYKVIDDANLTKMDLKRQIESMKEELGLLSKNHEEDVKMLYNQLAGSQLEELEAPIGTGLDDILEKIRIHWEKDIEKNRVETGALLHTKGLSTLASFVDETNVNTKKIDKSEVIKASLHLLSLSTDHVHIQGTIVDSMGNALWAANLLADISLLQSSSEVEKSSWLPAPPGSPAGSSTSSSSSTFHPEFQPPGYPSFCCLRSIHGAICDGGGITTEDSIQQVLGLERWFASRALWQATESAPAVQTQEEELVESLRTEFHETACKIQSLQAETESLRTLEEDEWKEFEQKEEIDYSGLRVHSMQISEKEDDEGEKREEPGDNWEEAGGGLERASGPWNKTAPVQAPVAETIVTETPEPVQSSGVYRPPGARETRTRKAPQGPPEIYSDTQFPSLQSTAKHVDSRKDKEMEKSFEVVKHKNRGRDEVSKNQALKLQLDNQYAVLGDQ
ncbi:Phakinin [Chelonia mydas]|uniref:Phakinin n=1 Tax=Chelonia mydas TaxID=8469 RepID=M7BHL5_CHEMY|nr:Phakinin [Chelonia mydas]